MLSLSCVAGWPKLSRFIFFTTADGGVAVGVFVPARARLPNGSQIAITTDYPFDDTVTITFTAVRSTPLHVRIPGWATAAAVTVNGALQPNATAGTMFTVRVPLLRVPQPLAALQLASHTDPDPLQALCTGDERACVVFRLCMGVDGGERG